MARGRAVYNAQCYYCHGYNGDGRTVAGKMLEPPPRDLTTASDLDSSTIASTVRYGRPGTAMQPFDAVLNTQDIADVAAFVSKRLARCAGDSTGYHTPANGWPDHSERYSAAYPFAEGMLFADTSPDDLTPFQSAGRALFLSACISCHEGQFQDKKALLSVENETRDHQAVESDGHDDNAAHSDDYDVITEHDIPPEISDLTSEEKKGRDLYTNACAQCHAADGSGLNWIGRFLRPPPPDFTAPGFASEDFAIRTLRPRTGTSMPTFENVLDAADAAAIEGYVQRAFIYGSAR